MPVRAMHFTRRQAIQTGGYLAIGMIAGTVSAPLFGCGRGNGATVPFAAERMKPVALDTLKLTVLYDNNHYQPGLKTDWGFSCLVEGLDRVILFDTGRFDTFLFDNMKSLAVDPRCINDIVISHKHEDHTGGLNMLLDQKSAENVYIVPVFGLSGRVAAAGAELTEVSSPMMITPCVVSTGAMRSYIISEQAMAILTHSGAIVLVGCAHPGVVEMVERVIHLTGMNVLLVIGGYHLGDVDVPTVERIARQLMEMGVLHVAPTHCTGTEARKAFKRIFGDRYLECGVGRVITARDLGSRRATS